jgi:hypothetical protein
MSNKILFTDEDIKNYSLIKDDKLAGCMVGKQPTQYIEYCCEGRLCSKECHDIFYKQVENGKGK